MLALRRLYASCLRYQLREIEHSLGQGNHVLVPLAIVRLQSLEGESSPFQQQPQVSRRIASDSLRNDLGLRVSVPHEPHHPAALGIKIPPPPGLATLPTAVTRKRLTASLCPVPGRQHVY